jgi:hypothetical protein
MWIASGHVAVLAVQLAFALLLLSGANVFPLHANLAWAVIALGLAQALGVGLKRRSAGVLITGAALALPLLEAGQIWLGRNAHTGAHAMLALLIWCFALAVLIRLSGLDLQLGERTSRADT